MNLFQGPASVRTPQGKTDTRNISPPRHLNLFQSFFMEENESVSRSIVSCTQISIMNNGYKQQCPNDLSLHGFSLYKDLSTTFILHLCEEEPFPSVKKLCNPVLFVCLYKNVNIVKKLACCMHLNFLCTSHSDTDCRNGYIQKLRKALSVKTFVCEKDILLHLVKHLFIFCTLK